ncbi:MAG: hypothetical protein MZV64_61255 [Ignavibacteriales bacterium]|nr:hypothetical protein [Ignavibacteriales bacterium]
MGRFSLQPQMDFHYLLYDALKNLGLMPRHKQAIKACKVLLDEGLYEDGGINYFYQYNHSETYANRNSSVNTCIFSVGRPKNKKFSYTLD